jgi:hypothetical protein
MDLEAAAAKARLVDMPFAEVEAFARTQEYTELHSQLALATTKTFADASKLREVEQAFSELAVRDHLITLGQIRRTTDALGLADPLVRYVSHIHDLDQALRRVMSETMSAATLVQITVAEKRGDG